MSNKAKFKIIDTHFHLPMVNPLYKDANKLPGNFLAKIGLKSYMKLMGVKFDNDLDKTRERIVAKTISVAEESKADKSVLLGFDGAYDDQGEKIERHSMITTPNAEVYRVVKEHKQFLPGPSINPMRKDAFEQLDIAKELKAVLIKFLPGKMLFDPSSKRFEKYYERVAELGIIILTHVGQEHALPGIKIIDKFNELERVKLMLDVGCKVIVAHGGGYSWLREGIRFKKVEKMLHKYPNMYLDNSALTSVHRRVTAYSLLKSELAHSRTIFGTDYPVPNYPEPFVFKLGREKTNELKLIENPIDRDIETKKALGFSVESFGRLEELIKK